MYETAQVHLHLLLHVQQKMEGRHLHRPRDGGIFEKDGTPEAGIIKVRGGAAADFVTAVEMAHKAGFPELGDEFGFVDVVVVCWVVGE
jgi:hypothetical protein